LYDYGMAKGRPRTIDMVEDDIRELEPTKLHYVIVDALERGETLPEIARRFAKGDKVKARKNREKLRRMVRTDPLLQKALVERGGINLLTAVPATTAAVAKRAGKGRMDAARVVMEASGVHNPRVRHEHSGEIKVSLDLPRPTFSEGPTIDVGEAEVID
jgi:hypothetical protein